MEQQDLILRKLTQIAKMLSDQIDEPLDLRKTAHFLGVSMSHVYKLTHLNKIPFYKPGGKKIYFSKLELKKWIFSNSNKVIT